MENIKVRIDNKYKIALIGNSVINEKGKELKPQKNTSGYLYVNLCHNSKSTKKYIHRLKAFAFIDNKQNSKEVNHIDGNKLNNEINNLEWVTSKENKEHAFKNNINNYKGENHKLSKLTSTDVLNIRKEYAESKITHSKLAFNYGVNQSAITRVINKTSWSHI